MLYFAAAVGFGALIALSIIGAALMSLSAALPNALARIAERAGALLTDDERDRLAAVDREVKAIRRELADLDESTDSRFKRLSARDQRARATEPAEPEPREDPAQERLPFGAFKAPPQFGTRGSPAPSTSRAFGGASQFNGR